LVFSLAGFFFVSRGSFALTPSSRLCPRAGQAGAHRLRGARLAALRPRCQAGMYKWPRPSALAFGNQNLLPPPLRGGSGWGEFFSHTGRTASGRTLVAMPDAGPTRCGACAGSLVAMPDAGPTRCGACAGSLALAELKVGKQCLGLWKPGPGPKLVITGLVFLLIDPDSKVHEATGFDNRKRFR
jgi:hypothetical protein